MITDWAEQLLKLQDVDMEIRNLELRKVMIPKEAAKLKSAYEAEKNKLKAAKDRVKELELELRKSESGAEDGANALAKIEKRSSSIRNNDEYQAAMIEIASAKARISDFETRAIELMDELEDARTVVEKLAKETAAYGVNTQNELNDMRDLFHEVNDRIEELKKERPAKEAAIRNLDLLSTYNRIIGTGDGAALVKIENGNCGHCFMKVVPQTMNKAKAGSITVCDSCCRILYIDLSE